MYEGAHLDKVVPVFSALMVKFGISKIFFVNALKDSNGQAFPATKLFIALQIKFGIRVFPLVSAPSMKFGMAGSVISDLSVVEEGSLIRINGNATAPQVISGIQSNVRNV